MIKNTVSIEEFRTNLAHLVGQVMYGKDRVIIKKYNREAAVLLSIDEYKALQDPTKRLDELRSTIPQHNPETIEKDVVEAIEAVRREKQSKLS